MSRIAMNMPKHITMNAITRRGEIWSSAIVGAVISASVQLAVK
jgi:hypothetical protein